MIIVSKIFVVMAFHFSRQAYLSSPKRLSLLVNLSTNLLVYKTDVSLCGLACNVVDPFPFHFQSLPSIKIKRDHDPFHSGIFPDINKTKIQKATLYHFNYNKIIQFPIYILLFTYYIFQSLPMFEFVL